MIRFLETFFRHRILVVIPVALGVVIASGYELAQPKAYEATTSIWIDTTGPGAPPASPTDQYTQPSAQQVAVLKELLNTNAFDLAVGRRGHLTTYVAANSNQQKGLAALPGIGRLFSSGADSVDSRVITELHTSVTAAAAGPQVVSIKVSEPNGKVAASTATAVVDEYAAETLNNRTLSKQKTAQYYRDQVAGAGSSFHQTQQAVTDYFAEHPKLPASGGNDATAVQLVQSADLAQRRYNTLLDQYEQARLDLANVASQSGIRVIDAATDPGSPTGFKKKVLLGGLAGAIVGLMIAVTILLLLTPADRSARRAADIERTLGLDVAATIGRFSPNPAVGPET